MTTLRIIVMSHWAWIAGEGKEDCVLVLCPSNKEHSRICKIQLSLMTSLSVMCWCHYDL